MIDITPTIRLHEDELRFQFKLASGPGGQNANKVATAAELRFDAAGSPSLSDAVRVWLNDTIILFPTGYISRKNQNNHILIELSDYIKENRAACFERRCGCGRMRPNLLRTNRANGPPSCS